MSKIPTTMSKEVIKLASVPDNDPSSMTQDNINCRKSIWKEKVKIYEKFEK